MADNDYDFEDSGTEKKGGLANVLTIILLLGTVVVIILAVLFLVAQDTIADIFGFGGEPTPTLVPVAVVPTMAPSATPIVLPTSAVSGLPPTLTPMPAQATSAPIVVNTLRPTLTPSVTPTFPPPTPTRTPTPTPTDTPTPGPSPTPTNTRAAFPFTKDLVSPQYLQNFANNAGCNWMGIAGEVFDVDGNPVTAGQYQVHVWDNGIDARAPVGGAQAYGPSGYELFLFDAPRIQEHNVQLETTNGTAVSQVYRIQTRASCNQNLVYFVFIQNH